MRVIRGHPAAGPFPAASSSVAYTGFTPEPRRFCPWCGLKLLNLATGVGRLESTEAEVQKDLRKTIWERLNLVKGKLESPKKLQRLSYYICGKCKALLVGYGSFRSPNFTSEVRFKILGTITDESLAMIIADSLKGENP